MIVDDLSRVLVRDLETLVAELDAYPDDASVMAYIGRSGWNDLALAGSIPDDELAEAVKESYRLVVSRLPRKDRPAGWEG